MSAPLPHEYEIELARTEGARGVASAGPRREIAVGPPPQWDGGDGEWSPEHLLLAAAASCLMTTFVSIARKSKLELLGYRASARGTLDKTPDGIVFTSIVMRVALDVPTGEAERARRLLALAEKHCIVSNSLKAPVALESSVAEPAREALFDPPTMA